MRFAGTWHITDMEPWDEDYLNMEEQAYIDIDERGTGEFKFCLVFGAIDGEIVKDGQTERFEFTWEGNDECDSAAGSGWLKAQNANTLQGRISFHMGDRSMLAAEQANT